MKSHQRRFLIAWFWASIAAFGIFTIIEGPISGLIVVGMGLLAMFLITGGFRK